MDRFEKSQLFQNQRFTWKETKNYLQVCLKTLTNTHDYLPHTLHPPSVDRRLHLNLGKKLTGWFCRVHLPSVEAKKPISALFDQITKKNTLWVRVTTLMVTTLYNHLSPPTRGTFHYTMPVALQ